MIPLKLRREWPIVLILLAAFALRVYRLNERPIWYDEAFSVFLSEQPVGEIVRGTAADIQPPLYYILLHGWQLLGEQPFVLRFLSVVMSQASVAIAYALAQRLFSRRAAVLAILFGATFPFQIAYAQELRMYALLELALLGYFYSFVVLLDGEHPFPMVIALALTGAVALYSQSLAILTWVVPDLVLLFRRDVRSLIRLGIAQGVTLFIFAPWLIVIGAQAAGIQNSYWTTRPTLVDVLQLLIAFTSNQPLPGWFLPLALFLTLMVDATLALEIIRSGRRTTREVWVTVSFAALPPFLMFALSFVMRPIFIERAVILSSLAFVILLGRLVSRIRRRGWDMVAAVLAIAFVAVPLAFQYDYTDFPRSPFSTADAFLSKRIQPGDLVLHDNKLSFFSMHYYDRSLPQSWLADPLSAGSNTLAPETERVLNIQPVSFDAAQGKSRIWFVIFQRAIDEARDQGVKQANLAWLDDHYQRVSEERFRDLNVYLFER